ncbi:MAG TPA: HAD family hydrolase [Ignavibacteriales bacterium]|nr:HAD family hydrolase [Ignavibacteriales bacterium]
MKAVIFDFGGTLDTDGVHWSIKFLEAYHNAGVFIPEKIFRNAYISAERDMAGRLKSNTGLEDTLRMQVSLQLKHLVEDYNCRFYDEVPSLAKEISRSCFNEVKRNVSLVRNTLLRLSRKYELGVISNFYGNLLQVLKELGIREFFSIVMDSEVTGLRKPDRQIYHRLLKEILLPAEEIIMTGDSYENDMLPAKSLGYRTIWLRGKAWKYPEEFSSADFIIGSFMEIEEVIEIMERIQCRESLSHYRK